MVLFIGYHATSPRHRASIKRNGLLAERSKSWIDGQRVDGIFVFSPDLCNENCIDCEWSCFSEQQDLWQVAYCGPMRRDRLIRNAAILPSVTNVTLVTGNE